MNATADFTSVRNHNERAVFDAVLRLAERYPGIAGRPELLADVACLALNRLPPRTIRPETDFAVYRSEREGGES
ncbi:MAG: late competence development ComFB family protein, partial [Burkholderiaceae bacterium]|nr:late competence development ComFB family protein [Burkholderiaceae bacterium]